MHCLAQIHEGTCTWKQRRVICGHNWINANSEKLPTESNFEMILYQSFEIFVIFMFFLFCCNVWNEILLFGLFGSLGLISIAIKIYRTMSSTRNKTKQYFQR